MEISAPKVLATFLLSWLYVSKKLTKYYIAIFANRHCQLPFLVSLKRTKFDVQISYGGPEVSEFYQEFISEV